MEDKHSRKRGCCGIIILLLCILFILPGTLWYLGVFGEFGLVISEDGVRVEHTTANKRTEAVIAAMRTFVVAQKKFRQRFGSYANDTDVLTGNEEADASAAISNSPILLYKGYYFKCLKKYGKGKINLRKDFVIVAIPGEKAEEMPTFAVGPKGIVLKKNMRGKRITNVAQIDGTWTQVD